jgi:N-acetylmuramoyl-L-alanine amidase
MKLVVNAGHGMYTNGKETVDGMKEFEFNSVVALYMRELLLTYKDVEVKFTHDPTGKTDIPLITRTNVANNWGADLWVSIHANAYGTTWNEAHGVETWVYTSASQSSIDLATKVQAGLVNTTGLTNRGVKKGNLHEVRETHMTAILIEHAFMTNRVEAELLKNDEFRRKCATSNVNQIASYFGLVKKDGTSTPSPTVSIQPSVAPTKSNSSSVLIVDGYMGVQTIKALQKYFGTPIDGIISKPSLLVKAIQKKVGAKVDGILGVKTISALQRYLGTPVDGKISSPSLMVKELQRRLNKGKI